MTAKRTPGPWVAYIPSNPEFLIAVDSEGANRQICTLPHAGPTHRAEIEANARLIAAAPALLAANEHSLRNVEAFIYALPVDADAIERASLEAWARNLRGAIAQATGKG